MNLLRPKFPVPIGGAPSAISKNGAPVSFSADSEVLTTQGENVNASALQSGYRGAYFIDEIRILLWTDVGTIPTPSLIVGGLGYLSRVKFSLGNHPFSQKAVPPAVLAPAWMGSTNDALFLTYSATTARVFQEVRWPLPAPLYVEPGDGIQANIALDQALSAFVGTTAEIRASFVYIGRTLPPGEQKPQTRTVPWVAHYVFNSDNVSQQTNDEFQNPFTVPLRTQRMVERFYIVNSTLHACLAANVPYPGLTSSTVLYPEVDITDSMGYKMTFGSTSSMVPVADVFDYEYFDWTFDRPLGPREQYNMSFRMGGSSNYVLAGPYHTVISMIGSREEML